MLSRKVAYVIDRAAFFSVEIICEIPSKCFLGADSKEVSGTEKIDLCNLPVTCSLPRDVF